MHAVRWAYLSRLLDHLSLLPLLLLFFSPRAIEPLTMTGRQNEPGPCSLLNNVMSVYCAAAAWGRCHVLCAAYFLRGGPHAERPKNQGFIKGNGVK